MSLGIESMSPADIAAVTGNNSRNSGDGMFGDNGAWWIIVLFLFAGWGRNGFGGYGGNDSGNGGGWYAYPPYGFGCGCGTPATQADLSAGFANSAVLNNLNDLKLGQAGVQQTLCQGFNGVNTTVMQGFNGVDNAICSLGYNIQGGINGISREIADCCCATQRAIDRVAYENQSNTCALQNTIQATTRDVIDNQNANSRAILDFLTQDKIATLTAENQTLRFQASQSAQNAFITANQEAQTAELIRRLGRDCPSPAFIVPNPNCCYSPCGCNGSSF